MKVLFRNRPNAFTYYGGDTTQMIRTARALEKLGVKVDICLEPQANLADYDLVHIFNIQFPENGLAYAREAKAAGKTLAVSTIYWDMRLLWRKPRPTLPQWLAQRMRNQVWRMRRLVFPKKCVRPPPAEVGIMRMADVLLPNSHAEIEHLAFLFDLPEVRMKAWVVPNAAEVDECDHSTPPEVLRDLPPEYVLEVARIESFKNQAILIESLMLRPDIPIVLVGAFDAQPEYVAHVRALAQRRGNTWLVGQVDQAAMGHVYRRARVHVLPSLRESPGLATLEAALCGVNCVVSCLAPVSEYFMGDAWICNPNSLDSVGAAVLQAWAAPRTGSLGRRVRAHFNYHRVAEATLKGYYWALANGAADGCSVSAGRSTGPGVGEASNRQTAPT